MQGADKSGSSKVTRIPLLRTSSVAPSSVSCLREVICPGGGSSFASSTAASCTLYRANEIAANASKPMVGSPFNHRSCLRQYLERPGLDAAGRLCCINALDDFCQLRLRLVAAMWQ